MHVEGENLPVYGYRPLNNEARDIRLLVLQRRQQKERENSTLRCHIRHTSLEDAMQFEALSYVWGETTDKATAHIDGRPHPITQNLHVALMHLRRDDEDRSLWIDALCIDQANDRERSHQVALMHKVYSLASSVIVFLGTSWEGCDVAMDMLKMAADRSVHWDTSHHPHIAVQGLSVDSALLHDYLNMFLSSPWWTRTWTVQEYCVAKRVYFQYGHHTLDGDLVQKSVANFYHHLATCCQGFQAFQEMNQGSAERNLSHALRRQQLLGAYRQYDSPRYLTTISDFRFRQCLHPSDKIYGILGLLSPYIRSLIRPDYSHSSREVYTDAAMASITTTQSLDIMSFVYGERTKDLGLPSFVPDWTAYVNPDWHEALRTRERQTKCYNASANSTADLHSISPSDVVISGVVVDRILASAGLFDQASMIPALRVLVEAAEHIPEVYEDRDQAFWHTMCGNIIPEYHVGSKFRHLTGSDTPEFRRWQGLINLSKPEGQDRGMQCYQSSFEMVSALRRFVITEKGYMGWVSECSQSGDTIVLLSGGRVPYVLRAEEEQVPPPEQALSAASDDDCEEGEAASCHSFRFIGDAYIHGIMQGECYDEDKMETFRLV